MSRLSKEFKALSNDPSSLTRDDIERHKRHIMLKEIGGAGIQRLKSSSVAIVGAGALGGPCAMYLAAAGVGRITIYDDDKVELSNLQRQVQFDTENVGRSKSSLLAERLVSINPSVDSKAIVKRYELGDELQGRVLIDASDNYPTRFALNQEAHNSRRILISGAAARWVGQVSVFNSNGDTPTPCFQCFVPEEPPQSETCDEIGVVGAITGYVGTRMALEAIKIIVGEGSNLLGKLWIFDGLAGEGRVIGLSKDPACKTCPRKL